MHTANLCNGNKIKQKINKEIDFLASTDADYTCLPTELIQKHAEVKQMKTAQIIKGLNTAISA